jgi:2-polyprenyl-6-methoxyphenol hydroxylase-like FAD-dependent oxidoreductase
MSNQKSPSVLVVGAGPVGLAASLELDHRGAAVRLIEKAADRTALSKAVGINARTLTLLEASGVTERLLKAGLKIPRINLRSGGSLLTTVDFTRLPAPYNFMLSLPQSETERILEEALSARGLRVERGTELAGFAQDVGGIDVRLTAGDKAEACRVDYLAGCDGAHSTVRKSLGLSFAGERYPETWSLADVRMTWPHGHGEGDLFMHDNGVVLFVISLPEGRHRVIANVPDALALLPGGSRVDEILWRTEFTVSLRQVASYGTGRVYLAGDAAHIHSPAGGRGMNLGIEDACVLAERMVLGGLESYSRDRHRIGHQVVTESDMQFRMASVGAPALRRIRDWAIRHVLGSEWVQARFRRRMAGLGA